VHLRGNTTEKAHPQYLQKHYDLAFFSVKVDQPVRRLPFNEGVKHADQVLELGRDESSFLRINHGVVIYSRENLLERYHYMHVDGTDPRAKVQTVFYLGIELYITSWQCYFDVLFCQLLLLCLNAFNTIL
jgi:hypothetical protein